MHLSPAYSNFVTIVQFGTLFRYSNWKIPPLFKNTGCVNGVKIKVEQQRQIGYFCENIAHCLANTVTTRSDFY